MDFSWAKQLADQANQQELGRQDKERKDKELFKLAAKATNPFVEKLHVVITGATEEFNKHCMFARLRVTVSKMYKHSKTGEAETAEPDEVAYFSFNRLGYMYGIRGINGCVEFITMPMAEGFDVSLRLHELGVTAKKSLQAEVEPETKKVRWMMDGAPLDGPAIVAVCQKFFVELIELTNSEIK